MTRPSLDALAALLAAGSPLADALDVVGGGRYDKIKAAVTAGGSFADAASGQLALAEAVPFLRHGEKTGDLAGGLRLAARKLPRAAARIRYLAWTAGTGGIVAGFQHGAELFPNAPWNRIAAKVAAGGTLSEALASDPDALAPSLPDVFARAEASGAVPGLLAALADHLEAGRLVDSRIRHLGDAAAALALHLRSGGLVAELLPALVAGSGGELAKALKGLATEPTSGPALSERMAKFPAVFDAVAIRLVKLGETAGGLDRTFQELAELETRSMAR